jgi:hypothetical protein
MRLREQGDKLLHDRRLLCGSHGREGADAELTVGPLDLVEAGNASQADEMARLNHALLHEQHERGASGEHFRVLAVATEQIEGFVQARGGVILEGAHLSGPSPSPP